MIRSLVLYCLLSVTLLDICSAQEVVAGLRTNRLLKDRASHKDRDLAGTKAGPVELPFVDDFSGDSYIPDQAMWSDDYVFVNNTYSDRQITCGVATFDALDGSGNLYEIADSYGFQADQLTSQAVNLAYSQSDNVWISFLYQAGGLGDFPEPDDSLTLHFFAPEEDKWYPVWRAEGTTDPAFKTAMINISDPRFLKNGFRFRFTNYASLSPNVNDPSMVGNCDQWNLDYVRIGRNRNQNDTVFHDVALTLPLRSLLKNHEAMPWKQYKEIELQEMGSSVLVHYRNNDTITRNVTRNFVIWDLYGNALSHSFSAGASNIDPLTNVDYNASLVYSFTSANNDSALFRITAILKTDEFDPKGNDTLVYYQTFNNYFAFDDGTAEAGYGINGLGSRNAMFAYRFRSFVQDTLRAVSICFNESFNDANKRAFDLMVWDDNNGIPGNAIYTLEEVMVEQGQEMNGFYTYRIPDKVPLNGIFYVGWKQRSETFLNAGLDVNTPHNGKQFYWLNGLWQSSLVPGTVMIRPVVGNPLRITGVEEIPVDTPGRVKIWPNPAYDHIFADIGDLQDKGDITVSLVDLNGRELQRTVLTDRIDISSLPAGAYIVIFRLNARPAGYSRLIKIR